MPSIFLERLPLPSLRTYVSVSVLLLAMAVFYAHQTVRAKINYDPDTRLEGDPYLPPELVNLTLPYSTDEHFLNLLFIMRVETWCIWTLVNSCYCGLILLGKLIQGIVFGELRVSERQHLRDKFWNFVFYKFIFIFGVMNVQSMEEVVLWVAWFSVLGFLHLLTLLSKDRFEYLSFSPATLRSSHVKLMTLLVCILIMCCSLLVLCAWVAMNISFTIFAFLLAETLMLLLKCLYVLTRYCIQLYDMTLESVWEARSVYVYYTDLVFELLGYSVDFTHHLHMLLYGNIFLSMASLVICMQLRFLFYELQRRIKRHKNYLRVVKDMEARFPMATQEELEQNADDCAICWERMDTARKLPCAHLFHNSCLRSWLEQDTSCPTCRTSLNNSPDQNQENTNQPGQPNLDDAIGAAGNQGTTNHFFHFDGSRYVSWLPSFSVEVTHTNLLPGQQAHAAQTSQLDNMAREVQQVFPAYSLMSIVEDLRITRSVDVTIDNILEGRISISPQVPSINAAELQISENITDTQIRTQHSADSLNLGDDRDLMEVQPSLPETEPRPSTSSSVDPIVQNETIKVGGRFSKSADERMSMLEERKRSMLEQARRRYEAKHTTTANEPGPSTLPETSTARTSTQADLLVSNPYPDSNTNSCMVNRDSTVEQDEQAQRRALLLEATERRLDLNNAG